MKTLEELYGFYINDLYKYLLHLSGHPQAAEDLVQDTFIKAYEHLESYRGEKVRPWLFRIAHNTFIDWYRREKRQIQTDPALMDSLKEGTKPGPEECILLQEKLDCWFKAVKSLSAKSQQVILLRDYHDFNYREIAHITGISLTSVKVTIFRARQKIREVMDDAEL
ncbi:MAG: RNA polymerase sigma factor [Dethiobacteria bacterium]|jgi:RNA polymerase sigma-70 factor (ECF subfamily)